MNKIIKPINQLFIIFIVVLLTVQSTAFAATQTSSEQIPPGLQSAIKRFKQKPYQFKAGDKGFSSQTASQSFKSDYDATGVNLYFDRQTIRLALSSLGRGEDKINIQPAQPKLEQQKLIRQVADGVVEWYKNSAQGLEHGIDIQNRPQGQGQLTALFSLTGAKARQNGDEIILQSKNRTLHYGKLKVLDSNLKVIPALMQVAENNRIALVIDDSQAQYPLSIDPLLSDGSFKVVADGDDAVFGNFGVSVSLSGNTALIGADYVSGSNGSAYIFIKNNNGDWVQQAQLLPNDSPRHFGFSVSLSGDTALIGTESAESAYIFAKENNGDWVQQAKLVANDGASGDEFGFSVSLSGDIALIGAHRDDDKGSDSGSAYIFAKDINGDWVQQAKLLANDGKGHDHLGVSVSLSGESALIGSGWGGGNAGAYIFTKDNNGDWGQKQKLLPDDFEEFDTKWYGKSVSLSGDTALIGAVFDSSNGIEAGSAYIFAKDNNGDWVQQAKLLADDGQAGDNFGWSVSLLDKRALIGAVGSDDNGAGSGSVYIFNKESNGSWVQQQKLVADDGADQDSYGWSVSQFDSIALIGAKWDDGSNTDDDGSAYFYKLNTTSEAIPVDTSSWNMFAPWGGGANWEDTVNGLKFYGSDHRKGALVLSKFNGDFTDATIKIKWMAHGGLNNEFAEFSVGVGQYVDGNSDTSWGSLVSRLSQGNMTTKYSNLGSTVITDDTWYYTTIKINPDRTAVTTTTTGDYADNGGTAFYSNNTTISNSEWVKLSSARIYAGFSDNEGGTATWMMIGEALYFNVGSGTDTDGDGIGDSIDTDDDGDGVSDDNDAFPLDPTESVDTDGDGIGDNADTDDDGDGVLDVNDAFPLDPTESVDTDGDGIGNNADDDDDGDGVLDVDDAFPLDPTATTDSDGDGLADNYDAFPFNHCTVTIDMDLDGNGIVSHNDVRVVTNAIYEISHGRTPPDPRVDINCDGVVDQVDEDLVFAQLGRISTANCVVTNNPDLSGDGFINTADLTIIETAIYKISKDYTNFNPLADTNCDGFVNDADKNFVMAAMGQISTANCVITNNPDLNGDGAVDNSDLRIIETAIYRISKGYSDFDPAADTNCDGYVNDDDKNFIINAMGQVSTANCTVTGDADLDGDGLVSSKDLKIVTDAIYKISKGYDFNPLADTNCDGAVDNVDEDFITANMGRISTENCVIAVSADLNGDGVVSSYDLKLVQTAIYRISKGYTDYNPAADTNCDGFVNDVDINYVMAGMN